MNEVERNSLRHDMRRQRRQLSPQSMRTGSAQLIRGIAVEPAFWRARHLALYQASDGEPGLSELVRRARRAAKTCYLPALRDDLRLHFLRFAHDEPLVRNRFGIAEPRFRPSKLMPAWALDLVLLPLVAFDRHGSRLGMGKGYYDRSFAWRRQQPGGSPVLLGVAWSFQEVAELDARHWDVPLDGVATELGVRWFR